MQKTSQRQTTRNSPDRDARLRVLLRAYPAWTPSSTRPVSRGSCLSSRIISSSSARAIPPAVTAAFRRLAFLHCLRTLDSTAASPEPHGGAGQALTL